MSDSKELSVLRAASQRLIDSDDYAIEKFCHSAVDISALEDALQRCNTDHFQAEADAPSLSTDPEEEPVKETMKRLLWLLLIDVLTRHGRVHWSNRLSWSVDGYSMVARIAQSILSSWCIDKSWIDDGDKEGNTVLIQAARHGHASVVELLLADARVDKASVDQVNKRGNTALLLAAASRATSVVELLLADPRVDRASIDHFGKRGFTVLLLAAASGATSVVELLLADPRVDKASIDHTDISGRTALLHAARQGYFQVAKLLLSDSRTSWDSIVYLLAHHRSIMWRDGVPHLIIAELTRRQMCVIYPSTTRLLWPVPVPSGAESADAKSSGPAADDDASAGSDGMIGEPVRECALITSFFQSDLFDVNVLRIIREYATYSV
jgi:Ankyrin repeats (3 copies)/Ankyrin repeats (many copies)